MKRLLSVVVLIVSLFIVQAQSEYVNPLVGTDQHGHTFPGAIVPFGAIQPSPDTRLEGWDGCSAYHYSDNRIYGFSHTHLSGTGCSDYGDVLVMPFIGEPSIDKDLYSSTFSHKNETAQAGYYAVKMDNGIQVELTCSKYVAMHRITFPSKGKRGIVLDMTHRDKVLASAISCEKDEIVGFRRSEAWNPNQYCAYSIKTSSPIAHVEYYLDDNLVKGADVRGENCKAIIYFDESVKSVILKVAISAVDIEGAQRNQTEFIDFDFDKLHTTATEVWNQELGKIKVESKDKEILGNFYTALYHCYTSPYLYSDIDGRYRGQDGEIHVVDGKHKMYTVFSLWDTYRALHPLLTLIDRKRTEDFLYTFINQYREGGMLPVWELSAYETWCMIGYHSIPVILDAYIKGIHPYDVNEMLQAMIHSAKLNRLGRTEYAKYGYIPGDMENESISKTLEYAYDDWCIAQFAKLIGNNDVYEEFIERAYFYRNILDPNGFMHGKVNGGFIEPFDPTEVNNYFTEANSWQYSTYVPHDIPGYIQIMGGRQRTEDFLDQLFHGSSVMTGRNQSDITGIIGQYAHGNEPSHHAIYLYNYIGRYDKTIELAKQIMTKLYTTQADGLCGNEDCGQMSAWYVLSSLGFYPVCPGSNIYDLGYLMFDRATIQLENGKQIIIRKIGKGSNVARITINGTSVNIMNFRYEDIENGGEIVFEMTNRESIQGKAIPAANIHHYPPTIPYFSTDQKNFSNELNVSILKYQPKGNNVVFDDKILNETVIYYTTDGSTPAPTHGTLYTKPITLHENTTLKAIAYHKNLGASRIAIAHYTQYNKDKSVNYITKPDPQYFAGGEDGLIDGMQSSTNWRVGGWQGFTGDFEAIIDLQSGKYIHSVTASCLEDTRAWIFYPKQIEVYISKDGVNYELFGQIPGIGSVKSEETKTHEFTVKGDAVGRYLKIKVANYGTLPEWHISAGQQAWLFMDEIKIDAE